MAVGREVVVNDDGCKRRDSPEPRDSALCLALDVRGERLNKDLIHV